MHKTAVIEHFGSQEKVAQAMRDAGFPITQRGVSAWPDVIPLDRAVIVERITDRKLRVDFAMYQERAQ